MVVAARQAAGGCRGPDVIGHGIGSIGKSSRGVDILRISTDTRRERVVAMGLVTVQVWDATGAKRQEVQMPDDAPINRILAVLLEKMSFPLYAPDGQPLSYKLHHRASGKQLLDEQKLSDVGVKDGDVLRLQPEITAGKGHGAS
jgi:uncharacterized ubiquitin-like protein YukD